MRNEFDGDRTAGRGYYRSRGLVDLHEAGVKIGIAVSERGDSSVRVVEDATCLGCPCLCDDIRLVIEGDRIVEAAKTCSQGRDWYAGLEACPVEAPTISGQPVPPDVALDRAAEILGSAKAPIVLSTNDSTIEVHRALMAVADRIGAFVGDGGHQALARLGKVSATLGEVKDRADLIVYANSMYFIELPRFRERYAEDSNGRFIPEGRAGRTVIRLGHPYSTFDPALEPDYRIDFDPYRSAAVYATLRAIIKGVSLESSAVERSTTLPLPILIELAERLKQARYGAMIQSKWSSGTAESEAFFALIRELNNWTRFVAITPEYDSGADSVRTWQAGFGGDIDLGLGFPRCLTREGIFQRIHRGEVDALLVVGQGHFERTPFPQIVIRPGRNPDRDLGAYKGDVCITTAEPGIDDFGTVSRFDGVMLPLRPPFQFGRVSQAEVLRGIDARLRERGR